MREKKTFVKCARLLPYLRQCADCLHRNCALRYVPDVENHDEKALISHQEEQREFAELTGV